VGLRLLEKDLEKKKQSGDSFEWELTIIRRILDWVLDKRYSLAEAFKIIDSDFDGTLSQRDIENFLEGHFQVNLQTHSLRVERLFKILD
jgi:Ca2+-binding EF-hand superfamily protein